MSKQRSRFYQKWYTWILFFLVIILCLPTLFSTQIGANFLLGIIRNSSQLDIQASSLSLSWFGPQKASGVVLKDEKRSLLFRSSHVDTEAPLWKLSSLDFNINVHDGELQILPQGSAPIVFQNIEIKLNVPQKNLPLLFVITGTTEQQGIVGSFDIKGQISGLDSENPQGNLQASIHKFPLQGLDQLFDLHGLLAETIGPTMDLAITASTIKEEIAFNVIASSSQLKAEIATVSEKNTLKLKNPAQISLLVSPSLVSRFSSFQLEHETPVHAVINEFSCSFSERGLEYEKLQFQTSVDVASTSISGIMLNSIKAQVSSANIQQNIDVTIDTTSPQFSISTVEFSAGKDLILTTPLSICYSLEENIPLNLNITSLKLPLPLAIKRVNAVAEIAIPQWNLNTHIVANTLEHIEVDASGEVFKTRLLAKVDDDVVIVKNPFTIDISLNTASLENYFPRAALAKPTLIHLDMQPLSVSLKNFAIDQLQCKGKAYTDEVLLVSRGGTKQFPLKNPSLEFSLNGKEKSAQLSLASIVSQGTLALEMNLTQFSLTNSSQTILSASGTFQNLTPAFIDTLAGETLFLQTLLGNKLDLNFKLNSTPEKQTFFLAAKSPNINVSGNFLFKDNLLQLQNPGLELHFVVAKEAYPLLDKGPFQLQQPAVCSLKIEEMRWPISPSSSLTSLAGRIPDLTFDWNLIRLKGELFLKEVEYQQFSLNETTVNFEKREDVLFSLNSNVSPQGHISVVGEMPSNSPSQIKLDGTIKDFPTIVLDLFARLFGHSELSFIPVFGKTLNADVKLDLNDFNGPVALSLNSENTRISFSGKVNQGYLTLNDSLYAQVLMTPELSAFLLKQMNPLSIKEITSKSPITLEISPSGFILPLHPFDPSKIFLGKATLELGKISCRNEGNINTTLSILKWGKVGKGDILKLWFAPCDFSIKQGIASIERTEILIAESLDIALWGNVDLPKKYVDMTLGLTASALNSAFGIKNLPKDYVLQVPMRGPMNNVNVDTSSATAKITLLFAWQQKDLAGSLGGSAGSFFGGLINKVVPLPDMNSKTPPAKRPFPWEQPQKQKTSSHPIRKGDKPLKQLWKIIR